MNEMTLSVDITPALAALHGGAIATDAGLPSALSQPSAAAVEAFQSAMSSLVSDNRSIQSQLEAIVARPLAAPSVQAVPVRNDGTPAVGTHPAAVAFGVPVTPESKPVVAPESKPVVAPESKAVGVAKPMVEVTPEIVREFAETIAPLVTENREVQVALEKVVPLPLTVPESKLVVVPESKPVVVPESKPVVAPESKPVVAPEAKPMVAAKPMVEVTPEIVREFAETIAPLVTENREVQVALEKVVPLPLTVPESKPVVVPESKPVVAPEAKPVVAPEAKPMVAAKPMAEVTPEIVREFAETIAPLVSENREVQVALERTVPLSLEVPAVAPETKPVVEAAEPPVRKTVLAKTESANEAVPAAPASEHIVLQAAPVAQTAVADVVRPEAVQPAVAGLAATGSAPKVAPTPSEVLIVAAEAVADAIMVTPGLLSGEGRIHVQLKPDVLGGTEIQLTVAGRAIEVEFQPQTVEMGALIQRSLPQLEQHLAAKIHSFTVAATVSPSRRRKV